jgi:hypothetical protein
MTNELAERLRAANPVPAAQHGDPDERVLREIVGSRSPARPRRRSVGRRTLALAAAAVVAIGGVAAVFSRFLPEYFSSGDRASTPETVLAQLRSLSSEEKGIEGGFGQLDPDELVRLASFETENGLAMIYAAPTKTGSGFCEMHTIDDVIGGGGCTAGQPWNALPHVIHWASEWGDVALLLGRLEAPIDRIDVRFEDGAIRSAAVRGPWWVYLVGGEEIAPGHRPVALVAWDGDGLVAVQEVDPRYLGRP